MFPRTAEHQGTFDDYLGFVRALFREPERPLDQTMGTGPGGAYAYATGVWFQYLTERFGPQLVRELWEGSEAQKADAPPQFMDVTAAVLQSRYHTELGAEFAEFTRWNLLTGERAPAVTPGPPGEPRSYRSAAEYPAVQLEPTITSIGQRQAAEVRGLSARYFELTVALAQPQRLRLHLADPGPQPVVGTLYVVPAGSKQPGPAIALPPPGLDLEVLPGQRLLVVVSGTVRGARARDVTVYLDTDVASSAPGSGPGTMEPAPAGTGCALAGPRRASAASLLPLVAALLLGLRRRARS